MSTLVAVVAGIGAALWSASAGISHLIDALNVAYGEREARKRLRLKATALAFSAGAIGFIVVAFGAIALLPALVAATDLGVVGRVAVGIVRWFVLLAATMGGLALLYRYGPDRARPPRRWASPGAAVAAALWVLSSLVL